MTYTTQLINGRLVTVDLDAAGNEIVPPKLIAPPLRSKTLDYPPGTASLGLVQGMTDGSEVVRPAALVLGATGLDDASVINDSLQRTGGRTRLVGTSPAAPYVFQSPVTGGTGQYLYARGAYIKVLGTLDVLRWVDTSPYTARNPEGGGGVLGWPMVDLMGAGAGSIGYHAGDILQLRSEVMVKNAIGTAGTPSYGVLFDNQNFYTEQMYARTWTKNCQNHVGYQFGGAGTNSFARPDVHHYIAQGNVTYNGVVLGPGVNAYNALGFAITGNFTGGPGPATPGAALVMGANALLTGRLDVTPEAGPGAVQPQTINFAAGSIIDAIGFMRFSGAGAWTPSNLVASGAQFTFQGKIRGTDSSLLETAGSGTSAQGALPTGGTIITSQGGTVKVNPAGAVTGVILGPGLNDAQDLVVINLSANSITFAAAATSNVALGASAVIPALQKGIFRWVSSTGLWYGP